MNAFEFATAGRIVFGNGRLAELPAIVGAFGRRVLLVTGSSSERASVVVGLLTGAGCELETVKIGGEPGINEIEEAACSVREVGFDVVVGFGGGSVVDAAKAIAALATNAGPATKYLEVIGEGLPLENNPLPIIAVPTTSGTGAEVTRNAVLHSEEHRVKVSLRHHKMLPSVALVDSETTLSVPPALTATTGMDALTQLIEPFLSCRANAMTDAICREALPRVARTLERAVTHGDDLEARTEMAFGSLMGGLALANSGLGAVHGFASPVGGMFKVAHGAVCAALLPGVLEMNWNRIAADRLEHMKRRFQELSRMLTGDLRADGPDGIAWVRSLKDRLRIVGLRELGVVESEHRLIAQKAERASSMKGNPVTLTQSELMRVLEGA